MIDLIENENKDFFNISAEDDEHVPGTGNKDLTLKFSNPDNNKPFSITPDGTGKWKISVNGKIDRFN